MSDPTPTLPASIPSSTVEYYQSMPVYLAPPRRQRYWLHILLLLATIFTTLVVGSHMQASFNAGHSALSFDDDDSVFPIFPLDAVWKHPQRLLLGIPFSSCLMLILLAHEMGHYLCCVHYGVSATLPFFIPFPSLIGTMGAFIRIRSPIRSRAALFDIGIAGPIAGFVVACGVLGFALRLSHAIPSVPAVSDLEMKLQYPLIFHFARHLLITAGTARGATALPLPSVYLHPVAIAAWFGMLATSLNLLPGGQLDGGHIVFALAPRAHRYISRLTVLALIPMAVYLWYVWLIWAVLLELSAQRHPQVPDEPKIEGFRVWLAVCALVMLILTLIPIPIAGGSLKLLAHEARTHLANTLKR